MASCLNEVRWVVNFVYFKRRVFSLKVNCVPTRLCCLTTIATTSSVDFLTLCREEGLGTEGALRRVAGDNGLLHAPRAHACSLQVSVHLSHAHSATEPAPGCSVGTQSYQHTYHCLERWVHTPLYGLRGESQSKLQLTLSAHSNHLEHQRCR